MAKLSLNKAAAYAGKAKADILKALKSDDPLKKLSGEKNEKGHWEIDASELDRFFGVKSTTTDETGGKNRFATLEKANHTSDLEVEVATLREQLNSAGTEKGYLLDQIEALKERAERAERNEDALRKLLPPPTTKTIRKRFLGIPYGDPIKVAG